MTTRVRTIAKCRHLAEGYSRTICHCNTCGADYTAEQWEQLRPARGGLVDEIGQWRNCPAPCRSTHLVTHAILQAAEERP